MFRTIVADPPWHQQGGGKIKRGADRHYDIMKEADILRVMAGWLDGKVCDDAHLYMWAVSNHLPEALRIGEALGFRYITNVVWIKNRVGLGRYFRGQHELCLFFTKGRGFAARTQSNSVASLIGGEPIAPTLHSRKPDKFFEMVENRSLGPYLELFARTLRPGWAQMGNEVGVLSQSIKG